MTESLHRNGGARVIGYEPYITKDSYCDEHSQIQGESHIFASTLISSSVIDSSISESSVIGGRIDDSVLYKVKVEGQIELTNVVAETCQLFGNWKLDAPIHIHEGVWYQPPRFELITGENGVMTGIAECRPGHAMLACWCKPISELIHAGPRLGVRRGWTTEQINKAKLFYEMLADCPTN